MNPRRASDRVFQWIAGSAPVLFLAIATVEGALRGGYDPIAQPISALALGPRGWVQDLNFVIFAASFFALAAMLRAELRGGVASIAAPAIFLLMTLGSALAGIFTMDLPDAPRTLSGQLHLVGGFLIFPWMPIALLVVARRFRRDARFRPYFGYTLATGLFILATITFFMIFVGPPELHRPYARFAGLVQRVMLVAMFTWSTLITWRVSRGVNAASTAAPARDASRALST